MSLCTHSRQSALAAAAAPSSNVEWLRFQQIGGREGNCGGSAVAVLRQGMLLFVLLAGISGHSFLMFFAGIFAPRAMFPTIAGRKWPRSS